ncbi:MAG: hypothetical protein ABWZ86_03215 [Hyphomicrobium sp.]
MSAALGDFRVDPALTPLTALLDPDQARANFGQRKRTNLRRAFQPVHGGVYCRDGNRRAPATVHLFIEVPKDDAGSRQNARTGAHEFGNRDVDIAIGNDVARANNQFRLQSIGVQGPGIGYPVG